MNHAPLAPSSAARTEACPGSVSMQLHHPQDEDDETRAGDAAHWAAAHCLDGGIVDVGLVAPNDVTLTLEMVEAAEEWAGHIAARADASPHPVTRYVEHPIVSDVLHAENWGTPDNVDTSLTHLYVDDYKFGHDYVPAFENWQLINYAILWLFQMFGNGWSSSSIGVTMTIYQPRCYRRDGFWRSWTVKAHELQPYYLRLKAAYAEAMGPSPPCTASDECRNCSARFDCEAALSSAQEATTTTYSAVPLRMTPEAKGVTLRTLQRAAKRLNAVLTGLEADVAASTGRGVRVPGFVMEAGAGSTAWKDDAARDAAVALGEMLGVDLSKPGAVTPLQAIAALKRAGQPAELLSAYIEQRGGASKLIEMTQSAAYKAFKGA